MKRKCLIWGLFIIGCALFLQAGCQEQVNSKAVIKPGQPAPKITFENTTLDFGQVGPNKKNTGLIKFTNTGESLLKITKVAECCGIVTKLEKMEYAPGESGELQVEWNSGPQESTFNRELIIHSNDPVTPHATLTLTGKVVLQVDWEPEMLRLFLDEENAGCPKITIRCLDNQPFSILEFKSTDDCITADFDSSVEATKFILQPRVNIEAIPKNHKGRVNINLTHEGGKIARILFSVLPKYTVRPSMMIVWDAQPEQPLVKQIEVLNNYHTDFEIESVSSKGNIVGIKLLKQRKIPDGYQLDLELTPPAAGNQETFKDEFLINIKGDKKLEISCNGRYSIRRSKPKS